VIAQQMSQLLGQAIVIENVGGAGGAVGTERMARQEPNGYTLGAATSSHPSLPFLVSTFKLDPANDFTPICLYGRGPVVMLVNPTLPIKNVAEFISYVKANPGKLNYAVHSGQVELDAGYLAKMGHLDMMAIPYRGGPQAVTAVIANEAQMMMLGLAAAKPYMDSGQMRAIGISSGQSYPGLVDLPEIGKTGLPGYEGSSAWVGLMGPPKLPADVQKTLSDACQKVLRSETTAKAMIQFGMLVADGSPDELDRLIRSDYSLFKKQADLTGVSPK
jgi:tripartite-type tricarboxylate transporter receptor subunit TctC